MKPLSSRRLLAKRPNAPSGNYAQAASSTRGHSGKGYGKPGLRSTVPTPQVSQSGMKFRCISPHIAVQQWLFRPIPSPRQRRSYAVWMTSRFRSAPANRGDYCTPGFPCVHYTIRPSTDAGRVSTIPPTWNATTIVHSKPEHCPSRKARGFLSPRSTLATTPRAWETSDKRDKGGGGGTPGILRERYNNVSLRTGNRSGRIRER